MPTRCGEAARREVPGSRARPSRPPRASQSYVRRPGLTRRVGSLNTGISAAGCEHQTVTPRLRTDVRGGENEQKAVPQVGGAGPTCGAFSFGATGNVDNGPTAATWALAAAALLTFVAITYQAVLTRKLAASTQQDVAAQWQPLLVPCRLQGQQISVARGGMGFDTIELGWANLTDEGEFHCGFENVGKGPALALAGCELALPISDGKRSPYYFNPLATPVLPIDGKA